MHNAMEAEEERPEPASGAIIKVLKAPAFGLGGVTFIL